MDPNATYANLIAALEDNDREHALNSLSVLIEWLSRGGFVPEKLGGEKRTAIQRLHNLCKAYGFNFD